MVRRIRPHHIVIGLGVGLGLFSVFSGVVPLLTGWEDDSPIKREVFTNIPGAWKLGFYVVLTVMFLYGAALFSFRVRNWERGAPDNRATNAKTAPRRMRDFRAGVYMKTLLRDPAAGIMHSLIYFSFLVLFCVTLVLEANHQLPRSLKFLHGDVYRGYAFIGALAGTTLLIGVVWPIVRRYVQRPYRIRIK